MTGGTKFSDDGQHALSLLGGVIEHDRFKTPCSGWSKAVPEYTVTTLLHVLAVGTAFFFFFFLYAQFFMCKQRANVTYLSEYGGVCHFYVWTDYQQSCKCGFKNVSHAIFLLLVFILDRDVPVADV